MNYLKIIFYGLLAFIERNPLFTLIVILLAVFAPVVFKAIGWVILAIIVIVLLLVAMASVRIHRMRRQMEDQFRNAGGAQGFGGAQNFGGFSSQGFGNMQGMTLEELVRRMQEQANAQKQSQNTSGQATTHQSSSQTKRVNDKVGDYVDFEEVE